MNEATLNQITAELRDKLVGRKFGKIFVLGREKIAVDFRRDDGRYLYISPSPSSPRLFLIKRSVKELRDSESPGVFVNVLRKRLTHAVLKGIQKHKDERVVEFEFDAGEETVNDDGYTLVVQLTGRSSNAFLLDPERKIIESMRESHGEGQSAGTEYGAPQRPAGASLNVENAHERGEFETLSESLDFFYAEKDRADQFRSLANSAKASVRGELKKQKRLRKALLNDLKRHGEPEKWKRLGDLVNANIATARREGNSAFLTDYFDEQLPEIEIEIEENQELSEVSENFYKKYSKARNAKAEINKRLDAVDKLIERLSAKMEKLDSAISAGDAVAVDAFLPKKKKKKAKSGSRESAVSKHAREYTSSDGLPILVGKRSKDNDHLTFRIARSLDMWFHAADYPGSHVIVRRQGREEIPRQTILEAARLAAFYSKAKNESKAAVRYTEKKFVNKPRGAAPGLVSLSSSKTLLVKPGIPNFGKN